jgi:hypothetical protein
MQVFVVQILHVGRLCRIHLAPSKRAQFLDISRSHEGRWRQACSNNVFDGIDPASQTLSVRESSIHNDLPRRKKSIDARKYPLLDGRLIGRRVLHAHSGEHLYRIHHQ